MLLNDNSYFGHSNFLNEIPTAVILPDVNDLAAQIAKFMGPTWGATWVLSAPDGPYVGPMNVAIRECTLCQVFFFSVVACIMVSIVAIYNGRFLQQIQNHLIVA